MLDKNMFFCDGMTIRSLGTKYSTNVVKLPSGEDAFGNTVYQNPGQGGGPRPWLHVTVDTAFTSADSTATLQLLLYAGTTSTSGGNSEVYRLASVKNTSSNLLAGDTLLNMPLPGYLTTQDHLELGFVVGTTVFTAGAVNGWIDLEGHLEK
jgi:hypothetical protein